MEKYRILYVEDNPTEYEMVKALLESSSVVEYINRVERKREFISEIRKNKYDLILTDFTLQFFHGFEVLQLVEKEKKDIPVIIITGTLPDEIAAEVIKKGASDYILLQNIYRLLASIRSVVERKKMQDEKNYALERLRESEENYRILAESSPFGIIVHNNFKIKYYNRQALSILKGNENENYIDRSIIDFIHPGYRSAATERTLNLYKGLSYPDFFEMVFQNTDGEVFQVEIASTGIRYCGEPSAQVIFRDISERKKMEIELIKAKEKAEESDRLKTAFLENMSHEIRTPLNGIIGFSTLLKYKSIDHNERVKYLEIIEQSGKHLLNIINDLIEISRIESGHIELRKEQVNLNNILDDLLLFFNNSAKIKDLPVSVILHKAVSDENSFTSTDYSRLKQILINLLNNALKFTRKGRIDFGYEITDDKLLTFFVRDTGIGIPDQSKDYIFERFRQAEETTSREFGGAGLGLTISKGLVEIMGGEIWFDSVHGEGTHFYFTMPLTLSKARLDDKILIDENVFTAEWKGKLILIADDEHSNFLLLKHILRHTGVIVERAVNGIEVLDKLEKHPSKYDLILMDIKMPEMGGLETIKKIREGDLRIPVIAQTAYAMTDDRQKCIHAGFDEYITKPVKATELLYQINRFFKKQ